MKTYAIQVAYNTSYAGTVTLEASSPEAACEEAIRAFNEGDVNSKSTDWAGETYVDAISETEDNPWDQKTSLAVPPQFNERSADVRCAVREALSNLEQQIQEMRDAAAVGKAAPKDQPGYVMHRSREWILGIVLKRIEDAILAQGMWHESEKHPLRGTPRGDEQDCACGHDQHRHRRGGPCSDCDCPRYATA